MNTENTENKLGDMVEERRRKIGELTQKTPEEIESAVLPTVNDIYSHADFNRRHKEDLLNRGEGQE